MTREEYLSITASKYEELQALKKNDNFYPDNYRDEKGFEKIFIDLARTVLEENLGKPTANRRKKTLTKFGYIEINNQHEFSNGMNGFQISPLLQVSVGHSQVHRVADTYGKELAKTIAKTRTLAPLKPDEVLYGQTDGSMLFTRDGGLETCLVGRQGSKSGQDI